MLEGSKLVDLFQEYKTKINQLDDILIQAVDTQRQLQEAEVEEVLRLHEPSPLLKDKEPGTVPGIFNVGRFIIHIGKNVYT